MASSSSNIINHINWVGEVLRLPHEVLVILRILDIEPEYIYRHALFVKALLNSANVIRANIVPPALVVPQCPVRR